MKKEILIFILVLLVLAFIQHPDLLSSPVDRIKELPSSIVYGMGAFHPVGFALVGYIVVWLIRLVVINPIYKIIKKAQS